MSTEKIYPKGLRVFPKHANAPEFVMATVVISPNELLAWLKENTHLLTEYKDEKQLKLQMLNGNKGPYMVVDTYVPQTQTAQAQPQTNLSKDNLPF